MHVADKVASQFKYLIINNTSLVLQNLIYNKYKCFFTIYIIKLIQFQIKQVDKINF